MSRNVLILVDVQNSFACQRGSLYVKPFDDTHLFINRINKKVEDIRYDLVIATKDWHPDSHISFASAHKVDPYSVITIKGKDTMVWPDHCIQGTWGADFPNYLSQGPIKIIFHKGMHPAFDSYSGVKDDNGNETGLTQVLDLSDYITLIGVAYDYCVKATALDLKLYGYHNVYVDKSACAAVSFETEQKTDEELKDAGVEIINKQRITPLADNAGNDEDRDYDRDDSDELADWEKG
jgi:nicotinamidase/pyrazinamidase